MLKQRQLGFVVENFMAIFAHPLEKVKVYDLWHR